MTEGATPIALSIAGSDSSSGAGIQADLKTFSALGVYGATVITAVTAQNTTGVFAIHHVPPAVIEAQCDAVFSDLAVRAVKTGMLGDAASVIAVSQRLAAWKRDIPLIVDPVMVATAGSRLLDRRAEDALKSLLIPMADLITPNIAEAAVLTGEPRAESAAVMMQQAERLLSLGCKAVLLKGGHMEGLTADDVFHDGVKPRIFSAPRLATRNTHGTGCTLSAAICAFLVKGLPLPGAIGEAKAYLHDALRRADEHRIGSGPGPVFHFHKWF